tara:strand:+ start:1948 stop:2229 length:282 start_codon:yes stop_codon:yes gene_type:complete
LSKIEIIKELKEKNPELNKSEIEAVTEEFSLSILNALKNGRSVEIRNFGNFYTKKLKENFNARNPATNELIYKPERIKIRFKPSKNLKKMINK